MDEWSDLADSELRIKLEQRGMHPEIAQQLVRLRESEDEVFKEEMEKFLEGG